MTDLTAPRIAPSPRPAGTVTQIWRYGLIGVLNTLVGFGTVTALHLGAGLGLTLSNALGYSVGLILSYLLNRAWTFAHRGQMRRSLPPYAALVLASFAGNLVVINLLLSQGAGFVPAQIAGNLVYSLTVFVGAKYVVFAPQR